MEKSSSIERLLSIPRLFCESRPVWTVEAVAVELGLPVSSTYRYFQQLLKAEYLDEAPEGGYCLGPAFIEFDRIIRVTDPMSKVAQPILAELSDSLREGVVLILCQVYRKKVMCIQQQTVGLGPADTSYERGKPMPMYRGATSKVILAHLPWRLQKKEYEQNQSEIAAAGLGHDWKAFSAVLRDIRKNGYCVSRGEVDAGRMGIAAPIISPQGRVMHSLSAVAPADINAIEEDALVMRIVTAASRITQRLAGHGAPL